ncbi:MAG: hypothetical protein ACYCSH_12530 [Acidithiobacillus sp.]
MLGAPVGGGGISAGLRSGAGEDLGVVVGGADQRVFLGQGQLALTRCGGAAVSMVASASATSFSVRALVWR